MKEPDLRAFVEDRFLNVGITPAKIEIRSFPGETIVVVQVTSKLSEAVEVAASIDPEIEDGFVTVRQLPVVEL